jgi:hypothetical protein
VKWEDIMATIGPDGLEQTHEAGAETADQAPAEMTDQALSEAPFEAPQWVELAVAMVLEAKQERYKDAWAGLRQAHGLSAELSVQEAQEVAAILLRHQAPKGVARMRRLSQRCGNEGIEVAGTTMISGSTKRTKSRRSDSAA